jgi:alpha-beta hydrolase superfamily lysophospholipase
MQIERVKFAGARGQELGAHLDRPPGPPGAHALFAHCFTCGKDFKATRTISRVLVEEGWAVLRFDFAGLGESEGDFSRTGFPDNVDDVVAAAAWLAREHEPPRLLIGHSLGGAVVLHAARRIAGCRAVATLATSTDLLELRRLLRGRELEMSREGEITVTIAGRRFRLGEAFFAGLSGGDPLRAAAELDRPLLVLHSPQDEIVEFAHAERLFAAAGPPRSLVSLDGAAHTLLERADAEYAGGIVAAWAARYRTA